MRVFIIIAFSIFAFTIGVWASPTLIAVARHRPDGHGLTCMAQGEICVGMKAQQVLSINLADNFGGLVEVYCGFNRPGDPGVSPVVHVPQLIERGCASPKYVAQFSDGRQRTSVWIENGVIVFLGRGPAHAVLDP